MNSNPQEKEKEEGKENGALAFEIWLALRSICSRDPNIPHQKDDISDKAIFLRDPNIASLIEPYQNYLTGMLNEDSFFDELNKVARLFRNKAMKNKESQIDILYSEEEIAEAEKQVPEFKTLAHDLIRFKLGHVPDLKYSASEQHYIRYYCAVKDINELQELISHSEIHSIMQIAITRIQFREVVAEQGWEAAEKLPLLWFNRIDALQELREIKKHA
jgi:hypothetical protein